MCIRVYAPRRNRPSQCEEERSIPVGKAAYCKEKKFGVWHTFLVVYLSNFFLLFPKTRSHNVGSQVFKNFNSITTPRVGQTTVFFFFPAFFFFCYSARGWEYPHKKTRLQLPSSDWVLKLIPRPSLECILWWLARSAPTILVIRNRGNRL